MKDESRAWIVFAQENLTSAQILYSSHLYNPCLQNIQQAVEKALKAIIIEKSLRFSKTQNILELKQVLSDSDISIDRSDDERDFLDTIYLPSKYPLSGVLPDFNPNEQICLDGLKIAEKVLKSMKKVLDSDN
ncbi:MAG: HEPN domain-containing protein [Desulfobacterales bacterium]|jgi:HEPN domain-containing protein|nr:HEPN domain-containing protein [Desulfobacterales bacterium]